MDLPTLADLYKTGRYTDLTFNSSDGEAFHVHKAFIATRYPWFEKKEMERIEAGSVMLDFQAEVVKRFVDYLYGVDDFHLSLKDLSPEEETSELLDVLNRASLASEYAVHSLRTKMETEGLRLIKDIDCSTSASGFLAIIRTLVDEDEFDLIRDHLLEKLESKVQGLERDLDNS